MEELCIYRYPKYKNTTCKDLFLIDEALFLNLVEAEMTRYERFYRVQDEEMVDEYLSYEDYSHIDKECLDFYKKHYLVRSFMESEMPIPDDEREDFKQDSERLNTHSVSEKVVSFDMDDGIAKYIAEKIELEPDCYDDIPKELLEDVLIKCNDIVNGKVLPRDVFPLWEYCDEDNCDYEYALKAISNIMRTTDFSKYNIGCSWL